MTEPNATPAEPPPAAPTVRPPYAAIAASVILLALWLAFTVAARPLTPVVIAIAEGVEHAGGWDVQIATGKDEK
jgi:hypothetical protein